jgi:prepilin-type N-terminal cleavage/methylation domain-containing protein
MRDRRAGFTLLELLVVMTLIGVLMGMGIGFLQRRGTDMDVALSVVRDQLRIAALTARTRHLPTEVVSEGAGPERPATMRARVLAPVGQWHMEERERWQGGAPSDVAGTVEPGRFGMARRPSLEQREPLLAVRPEGRSYFDLAAGFALRIDLRLEQRAAMTVARLGTGLVVRLDPELVPAVKFVGMEGGGRPGGSIDLRGKEPLRRGQWLTLEVVHDGRRLALSVDGRERDAAAASLPLYQTKDDVFEVSPSDEPVDGLVDEVQLLAYEFSAERDLPVGVDLVASPPLIEFGRLGELVRPARFVLTVGDDQREFRVGPGGVIE